MTIIDNNAPENKAEKRDGHWFASGIMLQKMPEEGGENSFAPSNIAENIEDDDWHRAMLLVGSLTEQELVHEDLNSHDILFRLFHEEGVRVFEPLELKHQCRCSQERVFDMIRMMSEEDQKDMVEEGEIKLKCEFCSKDYIVQYSDIKKEK